MRRVPRLFELNALSITLFYLIFAILWILLSDQLLVWITNEPELISRYQTIKGLFYVVLTAVFLYYLITMSNSKISHEKSRVDTALEATSTATGYLNLENQRFTHSSHFHKLLGLKSKPREDSLISYFSQMHEADRKVAEQEIQKVAEGESLGFDLDFRVYPDDESERWIRCNSTVIEGGENSPSVLTGVFMDITRQKELERKYAREKELFESIFQNIPIMIDVTSEDLEAIRVNKAYQETMGWTEEELEDENIMKQAYPDPQIRARALKVIDEADGSWYEFENFTKDGDKRIQQWANIRLSDGSTVGIGLDITEKKELERKHEHDRLELQKVYDNIPVFINLHDAKGQIYRVNKHFEDIVGYNNEDLKSLALEEQMFPDQAEAERASKHMEKADGSWDDFRIENKDGEIIYTTWSNIKITDNLAMGIGLDTTALKQKERELEELNARYRKSEEMAKLGHWKRNLNTNESIVSSGFYDIVEIDPDEGKISVDMLEELIHKEDWDYFVAEVENGIESGKLDFTYRVVAQKSGAVKHLHELGQVQYDDNEEAISITGTIQDITEVVEYQTKLQEVTERYRKAEEIASIGHWWRNVQTDEVVWSKGIYDAIGLPQDEEDTSYAALLDRIHPDDREEYDKAFKEALKSGSFNIRYRLVRSSTGEVGYFHELAETEYDEDGNPLSISGTIQDMTEREEFQIKLEERNEFIETTLENLPIGVAVHSIETGQFTLMNLRFTKIYGWPKDVLVDIDTFFKSVYPDEQHRRKIEDIIRADMASEDPQRMSWKGIEVTHQNGEKRIVDAKNIPVYEQGLMISTVVDVTAQAEAEERLAESEHNYRLLFQKSPLPMWIFDPSTYDFVEVNNAAIRHYGYSRKEFQEMTVLDILPKDDQESLKETLGGEVLRLNSHNEWRHIKKNGEVIHTTIAGSDIDYFGNKFRLILVNDITKQKKAEEMVLASLVEGENKERARIARELHDGLGQYLAAANMNFDAVENSIEVLEERRQKQFKKGRALLKHAVVETAQISRNLLPRVVDDYGLALAIESLIDNYSSNSEIELTYYHNIENLDVPRKVEFNLYRIAQEGISNAVKYAEATQINVQLIKDELDLILSIDDNGKGFNITDPNFSPGLGLQTIKTRTGALGGDFEFDSKVGKGTFLNVIVPLQTDT